MCRFCAGRGVVRVRYQETPELIEFGLCQCVKGRIFRTENARKALAAALGVEASLVGLIEDLFEPHELPDFPPPKADEIDLTEVGRTRRKAKL